MVDSLWFVLALVLLAVVSVALVLVLVLRREEAHCGRETRTEYLQPNYGETGGFRVSFAPSNETIISYRHTKAIRQLPTTYLSTARGKWLEIVHEDNVSNDFRINIKVWYIPLLYGRSFADFGVGGFRLSCARQWAATLLVVPARFFATAVRRLRRKWSK